MQKANQDQIYLLLVNSPVPLSTNEIAKKMNIDWHTAKKRLDFLVKSGRIYEKTVNKNLTLYWHKPIFE